MSKQDSNMRERTMNGHKRLTQALVIQAALPIFFIFPPITIYGLYHLEFINFTIIEYLVYTLFSLQSNRYHVLRKTLQSFYTQIALYITRHSQQVNG
uniref:G_PROTEIN_RECEP_F1_2 domain-containing protein n=1 Tax=Heterorhabditis bacteriophora TaxID=37862 RepID=A0A1I7X659_HETBA